MRRLTDWLWPVTIGNDRLSGRPFMRGRLAVFDRPRVHHAIAQAAVSMSARHFRQLSAMAAEGWLHRNCIGRKRRLSSARRRAFSRSCCGFCEARRARQPFCRKIGSRRRQGCAVWHAVGAAARNIETASAVRGRPFSRPRARKRRVPSRFFLCRALKL